MGRNQNPITFAAQLTGVKTCPKCLRSLNLSEFDHSVQTKDGVYGYCKLCRREKRRACYLRNRAKELEGGSAYRKRRGPAEWQMREEKEKSLGYPRRKVRYALKAGKLIKPLACNNCSSVGKVEGHHPDYTKPLDVLWLCKTCHGKVHRKVEVLI